LRFSAPSILPLFMEYGMRAKIKDHFSSFFLLFNA